MEDKYSRQWIHLPRQQKGPDGRSRSTLTLLGSQAHGEVGQQKRKGGCHKVKTCIWNPKTTQQMTLTHSFAAGDDTKLKRICQYLTEGKLNGWAFYKCFHFTGLFNHLNFTDITICLLQRRWQRTVFGVVFCSVLHGFQGTI